MFTYYYWYDNYLITIIAHCNRISFRVEIISTNRSVIPNRDQVLATRRENQKKAACIAKQSDMSKDVRVVDLRGSP